MMNTQNCAVRFDTRSIVVSKSFLKRAACPFSHEYEMLTALTKEHPNFRIETIWRKPNRQFMPTYDVMIGFIREQSNAAELLEEFEEVRREGRLTKNAYMHVRRWFIEKFGADLNEFMMVA